MAILKSSKTGTSYDTETGIRTNADKTTTQLNNGQAITVDTLSSNQKPIKLPETKPDTSGANLNNVVGSFNNSQKSEFETEMENIKNKYGNTSDITNLMKSISDIETGQNKIAEDLGSTENLKAYKKYTTDIDLLDENTRQKIENLQRNNPQGVSRGAMSSLIGDIEREAGNKKAILTIQRSAALGDYNTAIETAKAHVETQLAPMKAELDRLKYVRDENKDFQTAEMNLLVKQKENQYEEEKNNKLKANEMIINAMQGKAPQSLITKANDMLAQGKTPTEIASVLGDYSLSEADRLDTKIKKASLANIYSQIEERKNPTLSPAEQVKQKENLTQEKTKIETFSNVALLANKLLKNPKLDRAVGLSTYTVFPGSSAYDFKQTANQLINTLAAANLDKMKGAMSDKDIQFLRNIESNLALNMSEKGFKDELGRIISTVTGKLKQDYGVDFKLDVSDLSNDELINLSTQSEDNATFFNNL